MAKNEILEISQAIDDAKYNLNKMGIFKYDTLDEVDPKFERVRGDVTVEIGGPSTHIKFFVLTRAEHTKVKDVVESILTNRLNDANERLDIFCLNRGKSIKEPA
ncbi:hypothetical protein LCGC14_1518320 [marine sediment metagenome]|uniref:Uncharacterized protein n=1 Tax=marine sediment metagenome TaxID=412755 RepID=A0A0F9M0L0_9ZZZZ